MDKTQETGLITIERGGSYAPCCYIVCQVFGEPEKYDWDERDEGTTVLVQTDWDWPEIACTFGWSGSCDETAIDDAGEYLDSIAGSGVIAEDPGYFE